MLKKSDSTPVLGQAAFIRNGRDAGQVVIIIDHMDERFVMVADGHRRKFDSPKKKNIHHLELYGYVSPEVQRSIQETGQVTNGKLRHAVAKVLEKVLVDGKKGVEFHGERRCN